MMMTPHAQFLCIDAFFDNFFTPRERNPTYFASHDLWLDFKGS